MLVDTSVWVDHLRRHNTWLAEQLHTAFIWVHPFVVGELACGNLANRDDVLDSLAALPQAPVAEHDEVLALIHARALAGRGLGWIDMHLLASAALANLPLWTLDRRLAAAASEIGVEARPA